MAIEQGGSPNVLDPATESKQDDIISKLGSSLVTEDFDYVSVAYDTTTDTYTFKSGGSGGDTVATVTVTYTDSTKVDISSVAKT